VQPGCLVQSVRLRLAQGDGFPLQAPTAQPGCLEHEVAVVSWAQAVGVPVQLVALYVQPGCVLHVVELSAAQAVGVPPQAAAVHEQPSCPPHDVEELSEAHDVVVVPVHVPVVDQLQSSWLEQVVWLVIALHACGVPLQISVLAFQVQPGVATQ